MALLKSASIFLLTVTLVSNVSSTGFSIPIPGHDLIVGSRLVGDKMIYQEHIVKNSKWFQIVEVTKSFTGTISYDKITQVQALDQITDGTGAYAKVVSGGPGYKDATLKFKSQRGYGINFVLEIYGRA